ncbi:MAG: hypothetical protein V4694_04245 [Pseudomonadota bacterium]
MKKILFCALFFCSIFSANAAEKKAPIKTDQDLCNANKSCRKVCDLKIAGEFDDLNPDHQKMILDCAGEITKSRVDIKK